ncbi:MAG TPA: DUF3486 family protein [Gammaproteobacteria bacterium]|nr:DUF3486 family protein [Gammaproteobacteria bacterium]
MPRPSSIDVMPDEIRSEIGRLRLQGCTIDQIVDHLRGLHGVSVSRSAMGRHVKGLERVAAQIRRSREVATALVQELGGAPESQTARVNIELLHSAILDLKMNIADGEDVDKAGAAALQGNPEGLMFLSKAIDHLSRAAKVNADFQAQVEKRAEERAKKSAAEAVEKVAKARGISVETSQAIRAAIFGVPPSV